MIRFHQCYVESENLVADFSVSTSLVQFALIREIFLDVRLFENCLTARLRAAQFLVNLLLAMLLLVELDQRSVIEDVLALNSFVSQKVRFLYFIILPWFWQLVESGALISRIYQLALLLRSRDRRRRHRQNF